MSLHTELEQVNQLIQSHNPFESHFIVRSHQVWDEDLPDAASLHEQASRTILEAVDKINSGQIESKTVGLAILAPRGVGKTHLLSRIRRQLKEKGNGFFIYACEYGNLSQIKRQFLQSLASSLKKTGHQGVMQWQELATALLNLATGKDYPANKLVDNFQQLMAQKPQLVSQITSRIAQKFPEIDNPYIIKAVVWTLSPAHAPFAINWLSGRELSDAQAQMMDLPNSSKEDKDLEAFNSARQILDLVGIYTTPVICFDELDGTESADEEDLMLGGFTRAQVVASLAKDIYNSLRRGVLLTAMYRETWKTEFSTITASGAIKDRIAHQEIELSSLKINDVILFIGFELDQFYSKHGLTPPHPFYPFEEQEIRQALSERPTVREILKWCAEHFRPGVQVDPLEKLEQIYQGIKDNLEIDLDDNLRIANAIAFVLQNLKGQTIEGVTILDIDREVKPKSRHGGFINFRILGEENGNSVKIGVCVMQGSHGKTVGAAFKYLTMYSQFDLTRGCLIRSKTIQDNWQVAITHRDILLNQLGGEWCSLKEEEVKPLLGVYTMMKAIDKSEFSDELLQKFLCEKLKIQNNPLICEILSDPSGQVPDEVVNEDDDLEQIISQAIDTPITDDLDDLDLST